MIEFFETYKIGFYICFFFLPFLQEDVSILGPLQPVLAA